LRNKEGLIVGRSIVVNHLKLFFKDENVAIVYIYCNYKERLAQTVTNLIASLLQQIVQDRSATPNLVESLYNLHNSQNTRPTLEEFLEVLNSELVTFFKIFIVIDAMDECPEDKETRANLMKALRSLAGTVNLMVTSRYFPSLAQDFREMKRLDIRANDQDVKRYVEGRIALAPRHLRNLQETIVNKVVENVRGM
jgi:hypothetical protein